MKSLLPAVLLALVPCTDGLQAAMIMIDDFGAPNPAAVFLIKMGHPNSVPVEQGGLPSIVGGERDVLVSVQGEPSVQSAQMLIGHEDSLFGRGVFQIATARDPGTVVTLQYDGEDIDGNELTNSRLLSLDLTGGGTNTDLVIEFLSVDAPGADGLDLQIRLTSSLGGAAVFDDIVPESMQQQSVFAPYASFNTTGEFSFAAIDSIEIEFNRVALTDIDFEIGSISTVPEPTAGLLLALGMTAAGLPRRRFRQGS